MGGIALIVLLLTTEHSNGTKTLRFPTLSKWNAKLNVCFFCDQKCIDEIRSYGYSSSHINDFYRDSIRKVSQAFQQNGIQLEVSVPHVVKFHTMYDDLLFKGTSPNIGRYNLIKLLRYFFKKRIPVASWLKVGCDVILWTPASDDRVFRNTTLQGFSHRFQMCMKEPYGMVRLNPNPALTFLREILNLMGVYGDDEEPKSTYHYSLFEPLNASVLKHCDGKRGSSCTNNNTDCVLKNKSLCSDCVMKNTNKNLLTVNANNKNSMRMSNCTKAYLEFWLQVANRYPTIYSHSCL